MFDPGSGLNTFRADRDEIVVRHQLDRARDQIAGQARHHRLDRLPGFVLKEPHQFTHRPALEGATRGDVHAGVRKRHDLVVEYRVGQQGTDGGVRQQTAGVLARDLVGSGQTLPGVPFLERIRGAQHLAVFRVVEAAVDTVEPGEQILAGSRQLDRNSRNHPSRCLHQSLRDPTWLRNRRTSASTHRLSQRERHSKVDAARRIEAEQLLLLLTDVAAEGPVPPVIGRTTGALPSTPSVLMERDSPGSR